MSARFEDFSEPFVVLDKDQTLADVARTLEQQSAALHDGYLLITLNVGVRYGVARIADIRSTLTIESSTTRLAVFDFHPAQVITIDADVNNTLDQIALRSGMAYVVLAPPHRVVALLVNDEANLAYGSVQSTDSSVTEHLQAVLHDLTGQPLTQLSGIALREADSADRPARPIQSPVRAVTSRLIPVRAEKPISYLNLNFFDLTQPDPKRPLKYYEGFEGGHTYQLKVSISLRRDPRYHGQNQPRIKRPGRSHASMELDIAIFPHQQKPVTP